MLAHGASRSLNDDFVHAIHQDLLDVNPYARELRQLARGLAETQAEAQRQANEASGDDEQPEEAEAEAEADADADAQVLGFRRRDPPLAIRVTTRTNSRDVGAVIVRNRADAATREPASVMIHLHRND